MELVNRAEEQTMWRLEGYPKPPDRIGDGDEAGEREREVKVK